MHEYHMLNKPKRVLCSNEDKFGETIMVDYIKSKKGCSRTADWITGYWLDNNKQ